MDIILWRHADAEPGLPDLQRSLSVKGQKQARRMAEWLNAQLPDSCQILASPARRTLQTAEALGRQFKRHPDLAPGFDAGDILKAANWPGAMESVLIVSHQPTLGQLAALLLTGEEQDWGVRTANVWWFSQSEPGDAASVYLKAVMSPDLLL